MNMKEKYIEVLDKEIVRYEQGLKEGWMGEHAKEWMKAFKEAKRLISNVN